MAFFPLKEPIIFHFQQQSMSIIPKKHSRAVGSISILFIFANLVNKKKKKPFCSSISKPTFSQTQQGPHNRTDVFRSMASSLPSKAETASPISVHADTPPLGQLSREQHKVWLHPGRPSSIYSCSVVILSSLFNFYTAQYLLSIQSQQHYSVPGGSKQ